MATLHLKRGSRRKQEEGSRMEAGGLREEGVAGGRRKEGRQQDQKGGDPRSHCIRA